mgnify:CR=1 FL=1
MRKHVVNCQIENEKKIEYIQFKINEAAILYIKDLIDKGSFTKEDKLLIIETLIANMKD